MNQQPKVAEINVAATFATLVVALAATVGVLVRGSDLPDVFLATSGGVLVAVIVASTQLLFRSRRVIVDPSAETVEDLTRQISLHADRLRHLMAEGADRSVDEQRVEVERLQLLSKRLNADFARLSGSLTSTDLPRLEAMVDRLGKTTQQLQQVVDEARTRMDPDL